MILLDILVGATPTEPLKIEVGKFYRTRGGQKVRIYATDGGQSYPIHGSILDESGWRPFCWSLGGSIYQDKSYSGDDIVGEWKDEVEFDFSILPPWIKFIAMDANGDWYGYGDEPTLNLTSGAWCNTGAWCNNSREITSLMIPKDYAPKWDGDWKDTLTKRK